MKTYRVFDIIGPAMIGPSSSHTAGACRIGRVAGKLTRGKMTDADVILYGSFATTGWGHGTGLAITAGLLGMHTYDERLRDSLELAEQQGIRVRITASEKEMPHPNTARIITKDEDGRTLDLVGRSVGGGNIEIRELNGMEVSFSCNYPTLLVFQYDRPGIISEVTGMLAEAGVNIAFMEVFRAERSREACMVIETDQAVPVELVRALELNTDRIIRVSAL